MTQPTITVNKRDNKAIYKNGLAIAQREYAENGISSKVLGKRGVGLELTPSLRVLIRTTNGIKSSCYYTNTKKSQTNCDHLDTTFSCFVNAQEGKIIATMYTEDVKAIMENRPYTKEKYGYRKNYFVRSDELKDIGIDIIKREIKNRENEHRRTIRELKAKRDTEMRALEQHK